MFISENEFQELYQHLGPRVQRLLQSMVGSRSIAEELRQETFIKAWKGLPFFLLKSSLSTWIYRVAINTGRDWLRSHNGVKLEWSEERTQGLPQSERDLIQASLFELEDEMRIILTLHYYEDLTTREISSILKIPEGTAKSRIHHAKAKLKPILIAKGFDV